MHTGQIFSKTARKQNKCEERKYKKNVKTKRHEKGCNTGQLFKTAREKEKKSSARNERN